MSGLRIYGIPTTRAFRVLWLAKELGLDYDNVPVGVLDGGVQSPAYLAVNPNGRVPAIDDGGFILSESLAINLYLAKKHATGRLYPATPEGEARAWQWSFWVATEAEKPAVIWGLNAVVYPPEKRDPRLAAEAREQLDRVFPMLERALAAEPYLLGRDFTVADVNVASVIYRVLRMDLSATPRLKDWLQRCVDRPAARAALKLRE